LEAAQRASQIPPNPDPDSDPVARSRAPSPGPDRSRTSGDRRFGDGEISPRFGPGWVGGSRGAMASAQAPSSSSAAPSRKEHLEAGKKRVGPLLPVACEKCSLSPPAIANRANMC
jgi:hypothetical protein